MASYPYVELGGGIPPIPILAIELFGSGANERLTAMTEGILDTGSDCTLVPLDVLMKVKARPVDRAMRVPVCGELVLAVPYAVGLRFDRYEIAACLVLGCDGAAIGNVALMGRDLMQAYRIEFDGTRSVFTIF